MIIYSSWVAGAVLYTVSADDKDSYDVDSLEVTMDDDISGYYIFDLTSCEWHINIPNHNPPVILYYRSFQGDTSVVVLIVLCFGDEFLCCLSLMYVFI